ncbi:hypothetical protein B9Z19DRAFT_1149369 [Tuber borchii]|uniref:DUF6536 domain-containing protein n=1 Tax=Tuber borchii TaxID=42251 RepID=A0A2T6ZLU9_TUBBO|nr:hypothetical protein B9Z19DRAFT_1149369 [Tuber borchii]
MDIGVPSIRNLFRIKAERALLWIAIGITSIPLHLLYNSAVYTTLAANDFFVAVVGSDHFEPRAHSNTPKAYLFRSETRNATTGKEYGDPGYQTDSRDMQLFISMLEGYNGSTPGYEDLTAPQCIRLYSTDILQDRRNLFLITNHTSNATYDNTFLDTWWYIHAGGALTATWTCLYLQGSLRCNTNKLASRVASGIPWLVQIGTGEMVKIKGCKSEKVAGKCKVQFSLGIMIAVICCNLVKACCMVMAVLRSREPTLVTLGDAIDSYLRIPDPTTMGICFADRRFIKREWRHGSRAGPRQWKRKGIQRWWTSVSKTRWITCIFFCSIAIIITGVLLGKGIGQDGEFLSTDLKSLWTRGFGKVNSVSVVTVRFQNITQAILLANLPQTILSFLYLTYNSLFTCMLAGHEWSLFSHHHRALRVTSPRPGQRSTYWLQIPYTYAISLMALSALLHWLTSQSIFLARVDIWEPLGREVRGMMSTVGYSCIAIIFALPLGILALLTAVGMGLRPFAAEITTVGSCSAAISAACHAWGVDSERIVGKRVR